MQCGSAQSEAANQVASEDHSDTAGGTTAVKGTTTTDAILKELDAMRARIAELEAQLKAQSGVKADAVSADAATQLQASRQALLASTPATPPAPAIVSPAVVRIFRSPSTENHLPMPTGRGSMAVRGRRDFRG